MQRSILLNCANRLIRITYHNLPANQMPDILDHLIINIGLLKKLFSKFWNTGEALNCPLLPTSSLPFPGPKIPDRRNYSIFKCWSIISFMVLLKHPYTFPIYEFILNNVRSATSRNDFITTSTLLT